MEESIKVNIVEAQNVIGADSATSSDPYMIITFLDSQKRVLRGSEKYTTQVIKKTLNPVWNEEVIFGSGYDLRMATFMSCVVLDKDLLSDDPLGMALVPVADITGPKLVNGPIRLELHLEKFGKMKKVSGRIVLNISRMENASMVLKSSPLGPGGDQVKNLIVVTLHQARGIRAMDRGGTSDPLVILKCAGQKLKSTTQEKTLKPAWEETFRFPTTDLSGDLELIMEDFDVTVNDFLGQVKVPLNTFEDGTSKKMTLDLLNKKNKKSSPPRGEIEFTVKWIHSENTAEILAFNKKKDKGFFAGAISKVASAVGVADPDAEDDDEGIDADAEDQKPKKSEEELKKEQEERDAKREELEKELKDISIQSGDYQVQVHIIEARDLVPKDATGTSDPVVYVQVLDEKQNTLAKNKTLNCVWDDVLIFSFRNLDKEDVEMGAIVLSVMDANTISRAELIGQSQFDMSYIYSQPDHQIANKWLALINTQAGNAEGVQGYLRVSITVLGPGDKLKPPPPPSMDACAEGGKIEDMVIMPPSVKQEVNFLVVSVHRAEHLPPLDNTFLKRGIDAFVTAAIGGGDRIRTRVKTKKGEQHDLNPIFNEELWLVLREPTMANNITLGVFDWDRIGKDDVVAHAYQSLKFIKKMDGNLPPMWMNLYGAPLAYAKENVLNKDSVKSQMNTYPDQATTFRGRLLLSFRIEGNEKNLEENNQKRKIKSISRSLVPATRSYKLRCLICSGSDIPKFMSSGNLGKLSKMQIVVSCGLREIASVRAANHKGVVEWNQLIESDPLVFPTDPSQIPDIFVYLCKGTEKDRKQIAYKRYSAKQLFSENMFKDVEWITLKEDPCVDALKDKEFPGNVLLRLGFGTTETAEKTVWENVIDSLNNRTPYQVRVNLFQGRGLPAADDNGLLDPYIKVRCMGMEEKTEIKKKTRDPLYYETKTFDVYLPPLKYAPQVILRLMDWDNPLDPDDYVGSAFLNISEAHIRSSIKDESPTPQPKWYPLMFQEPNDSDGAILASVEVIRKQFPDEQLPPPKDITPAHRTAYLELVVLGLRDMQPFQFMPIQLPFIEFSLGGKASINQEMKTEKSKRPSGSNPNFLQRIVREIELPENDLFAPMLNVTVKDTRLGGWHKPVIGSCSIDLSTKLPWGKSFIPPQNNSFDHMHQLETEDSDSDNNSETEESSALLMSRRFDEDIGAGVFGALKSMGVEIDLEDPALLSDSVLLDNEDNEDENDDDKSSKYLKNREILDSDVESVLKTTPFENYPLHIGQKKKSSSLFSSLNYGAKKTPASAASAAGDSSYRRSGIFKGLVRVMLSKDTPPLFNMDKLLSPQPYQVRLYVLDGTGFQPMDVGIGGRPGKSDPYLVLNIGREVINDRKNYIDDVTDPDIYTMYEFSANLPGASLLKLNAMDYDLIGTDDLIGSTVIDLEDRLFDKRWVQMGINYETTSKLRLKPLESRTLKVPTSNACMGNLKLWVDILTPAEASAYPPIDISLPPPIEMELRVVIWKTKEVPSFDEFTDMNDLFVRCWLEGCEYQDTDIHWRAKKGKGSFNWRMKFPVVLGHKQMNSKFPYFHIQMWDKDVFSASDAIAEGILNMDAHFKKAYKLKQNFQVFKDEKPKNTKKLSAKENQNEDALRSIKEATGLWDVDPTDSTWFKMERLNHQTHQREPMGAVNISMELVPKEKSDRMNVGFGRSDPNNTPFLPPPNGRLKFSMNPFYVFNELLGPKICHRVMCCLCCVLLMVVMYFASPFINILILSLK